MFKEKLLAHNQIYIRRHTGYRARILFYWSYKEDWKISMFLIQFSQPDKLVKDLAKQNVTL